MKKAPIQELNNLEINELKELEATLKAKNYYQILGIDKNADEKEINKSYHRQSRKYHPDKQSPSSTYLEKQKAKLNLTFVYEAKEKLLDAGFKKTYDDKLNPIFASSKGIDFLKKNQELNQTNIEEMRTNKAAFDDTIKELTGKLYEMQCFKDNETLGNWQDENSEEMKKFYEKYQDKKGFITFSILHYENDEVLYEIDFNKKYFSHKSPKQDKFEINAEKKEHLLDADKIPSFLDFLRNQNSGILMSLTVIKNLTIHPLTPKQILEKKEALEKSKEQIIEAIKKFNDTAFKIWQVKNPSSNLEDFSRLKQADEGFICLKTKVGRFKCSDEEFREIDADDHVLYSFKVDKNSEKEGSKTFIKKINRVINSTKNFFGTNYVLGSEVEEPFSFKNQINNQQILKEEEVSKLNRLSVKVLGVNNITSQSIIAVNNLRSLAIKDNKIANAEDLNLFCPVVDGSAKTFPKGQFDFSSDQKDFLENAKDASRRYILAALKKAMEDSQISRNEAAIAMMIALKNNGLGSSNEKNSLKEDLKLIYPKKDQKQLINRVLDFSELFQKEAELSGIFTATEKANSFVGMSLKKVTPNYALEILDFTKMHEDDLDKNSHFISLSQQAGIANIEALIAPSKDFAPMECKNLKGNKKSEITQN